MRRPPCAIRNGPAIAGSRDPLQIQRPPPWHAPRNAVRMPPDSTTQSPPPSKNRNSLGRDAENPVQIPARGWWQVIKRAKEQLDTDHIQIVSAGIAFYFFLSIFPILATAVSIYGLITDPSEAETQIAGLAKVLPANLHDTVAQILRNLSSQSGGSLGWGVVLGIIVSIWSAKKGTTALVTGLNIAYDEKENRSFLRLTLITLGLTLGAIISGFLVLGLVAGFPAVSSLLGLPSGVESAVNILRWPIVACMIVVMLGALYKYAPDRDPAKWEWVSIGSIAATLLWLVGSILFSVYIENFAKFGKTYGSFSAVVTLMLWLFLTAYIILLGAEINSESEHQTARDSTQGPDEPIGQRGAYHADHVADGTGKSEANDDPDRPSA